MRSPHIQCISVEYLREVDLPTKKAKAASLNIQPEADAGTFDEDLPDVDKLLHKIAPIRNSLISGDLRRALSCLAGLLLR